MRETFPREAAENPEPFTGARLTASIHGQVEIEHYHRYLFSRNFCRDRDVLDVASGEGYGAAHLAQVARRVVGVEYSGATALNAAANFPRPNLWFVRGDARSLPLADACVDVVTSFETIEHFDRQEDFVAEGGVSCALTGVSSSARRTATSTVRPAARQIRSMFPNSTAPSSWNSCIVISGTFR